MRVSSVPTDHTMLSTTRSVSLIRQYIEAYTPDLPKWGLVLTSSIITLNGVPMYEVVRRVAPTNVKVPMIELIKPGMPYGLLKMVGIEKGIAYLTTDRDGNWHDDKHAMISELVDNIAEQEDWRAFQDAIVRATLDRGVEKCTYIEMFDPDSSNDGSLANFIMEKIIWSRQYQRKKLIAVASGVPWVELCFPNMSEYLLDTDGVMQLRTIKYPETTQLNSPHEYGSISNDKSPIAYYPLQIQGRETPLRLPCYADLERTAELDVKLYINYVRVTPPIAITDYHLMLRGDESTTFFGYLRTKHLNIRNVTRLARYLTTDYVDVNMRTSMIGPLLAHALQDSIAQKMVVRRSASDPDMQRLVAKKQVELYEGPYIADKNAKLVLDSFGVDDVPSKVYLRIEDVGTPIWTLIVIIKRDVRWEKVDNVMYLLDLPFYMITEMAPSTITERDKERGVLHFESDGPVQVISKISDQDAAESFRKRAMGMQPQLTRRVDPQNYDATRMYYNDLYELLRLIGFDKLEPLRITMLDLIKETYDYDGYRQYQKWFNPFLFSISAIPVAAEGKLTLTAEPWQDMCYLGENNYNRNSSDQGMWRMIEALDMQLAGKDVVATIEWSDYIMFGALPGNITAFTPEPKRLDVESLESAVIMEKKIRKAYMNGTAVSGRAYLAFKTKDPVLYVKDGGIAMEEVLRVIGHSLENPKLKKPRKLTRPVELKTTL